MENIIYSIRRFDGTKVWYQDYVIPLEKGRTVLWGLIKIREEQDPTLNFTAACRSAICGSCGVRVNGNAVLACKTSLEDLLDAYKTDKLTIEPLANYKVLRDLVVDWIPKLERMKEIKPWLLPKEGQECSHGYIQSAQEFNKISNPTDCILCGCCVSECTQHTANAEGYYEPFIFTKSYRYAADSRDAAPLSHLKPALEDGGLWKCVHCNQCIAKCPKGVTPAEHISALRRQSIHLGQKDNPGARHAKAFSDDIRNTGRLNELTLPIKTEGLITTALKRIPFALRILAKGKLNPLHFPWPVRGIEGVRKIYKLAEKEGGQ